ncbi:MAG TPA: hypothetical protein QGH10_16445 [Armatimonadota bacterium]|nr:hypothetical protein [Armatimonadota bacterium]
MGPNNAGTQPPHSDDGYRCDDEIAVMGGPSPPASMGRDAIPEASPRGTIPERKTKEQREADEAAFIALHAMAAAALVEKLVQAKPAGRLQVMLLSDLPATERLLLSTLWARADFAKGRITSNRGRVPQADVMKGAGVKSRTTLFKAQDRLAKWGLLKVWPAASGLPPKYLFPWASRSPADGLLTEVPLQDKKAAEESSERTPRSPADGPLRRPADGPLTDISSDVLPLTNSRTSTSEPVTPSGLDDGVAIAETPTDRDTTSLSDDQQAAADTLRDAGHDWAAKAVRQYDITAAMAGILAERVNSGGWKTPGAGIQKILDDTDELVALRREAEGREADARRRAEQAAKNSAWSTATANHREAEELHRVIRSQMDGGLEFLDTIYAEAPTDDYEARYNHVLARLTGLADAEERETIIEDALTLCHTPTRRRLDSERLEAEDGGAPQGLAELQRQPATGDLDRQRIRKQIDAAGVTDPQVRRAIEEDIIHRQPTGVTQ